MDRFSPIEPAPGGFPISSPSNEDRRTTRKLPAPARFLFTRTWALHAAAGAHAQSPALVKDISPGTSRTEGASVGFGQIAGVSGGRAFLWGFRESTQDGLWVTDGSPAGTRQILGGPLRGAGAGTDLSGRFFVGASTPEGATLWESDGTAAGTSLVELVPASFGDYSSLVVTKAGGRLFFTVDDDVRGTELWASDGTPAGTSLVKVVPARADRGGLEWTPHFDSTSIPGALLTVFDSGACMLWGSDGTPAGTLPLVSPTPAPYSGFPGDLTDVNGTLFFSASDAEHGRELWKSDGSPGGTVLVRDLEPGTAGSSPTQLFGTKTNLFFRAGRTATGHGLYRTDGTDAGTIRLEDDCPQILGLLGEIVIFVGNDGVHGQEPFRSDGTPAGTFPLGDLTPGLASTTIAALGALNGSFSFLTLPSDPAGTTLWKTDGTVGGTVSVRPMAGHRVWSPARAAASGSVLVFTCEDEAYRRELWSTDGTAAGTSILLATVPLGEAGNHGLGQSLAPLGSRIVFWADDGVHGFEPWVTDGTSAGTSLLKDVYPGPAGSSNPAGTASTGATLFFGASDGVHGPELWKTDGTGPGTTLVRDIVPGPIGSITTETIAAAGHEVFFVADDQASGRELWRTNGTAERTAQVADLDPGPGSSALADLTGRTVFVAGSGKKLYFTATDGTTGFELWSFPVPTGFHTFVPCPRRPHL